MKLKDIDQLKLRNPNKVRENLEVNPADLISDDCFYDRGHSNDYRQHAVTCLGQGGYDFTSNMNLAYDMMKKWVIAKCPQCGIHMTPGRGGSGDLATVVYYCGTCEIELFLSIPKNGISVVHL